MNYTRITIGLLTLATILMAALLVLKVFKEIKINESFTPMSNVNSPHLLQVFFANLIYEHLKPRTELSRSTVKAYLNHYVSPPDSSFDLFYIPRRNNYCQANYLYTVLNPDYNFSSENYIFMDIPNSDKLKKKLSTRFDFLNTAVHRRKEFTKHDITKLQNMEWNPKIKIFLTITDFNYNNNLGKSFLCMFQMANHIPGTGILHREDLLADNLKKTRKRLNFQSCSQLKRFYPQTYRLYKKKECDSFFEVLNSKKFHREMKTRTLFVLKNIDSSNEQKLDHIEIHKLKRTYKNGALCGVSQNKHLIQNYIADRIRYKNGRKFVLRTFMIIVSTKPLVVLFHKGYVLLDRFDNYVSFNKAIIKPKVLLKYLQETGIMNEYEFEKIYNKIKRNTAYLNHISMDNYLKDPRFFQVIALDFVISAQKEPILQSIKGSPQFTIKNFKMVSQIIKLQSSILGQRVHTVKDFVQSLKVDMYNYYQNSKTPFEYYEDLIYSLKQNVDLNSASKNFDSIFVNKMPEFKSKEYSDFDLIYDGREDGIRAYKGLVHKFCLRS
jgi:hypothetical protein